MAIANVIVTVLLAALLCVSATLKLSHRREVVASYARAGVPEERLNLLAATLLAGAAGLLLGLLWPPIGIAAAACLIVYFMAAVAAHIRADDAAHLLPPLLLALLAAVALLLRIISA